MQEEILSVLNSIMNMNLSIEEAYRALELHPSANEAEVKAAYRRLALLTHPDKNKDDPTGTHDITICLFI